jgi:hypothetical protein
LKENGKEVSVGRLDELLLREKLWVCQKETIRGFELGVASHFKVLAEKELLEKDLGMLDLNCAGLEQDAKAYKAEIWQKGNVIEKLTSDLHKAHAGSLETTYDFESRLKELQAQLEKSQKAAISGPVSSRKNLSEDFKPLETLFRAQINEATGTIETFLASEQNPND